MESFRRESFHLFSLRRQNMCGRFALPTPTKSIARQLSLTDVLDYPSLYNIAPTQQISAVVHDSSQSGRIIKFFHLGLIQFWAKDTKIGSRLINTRAETLTEKPAFRAAFKKRRCLIPAAVFYEWKKEGSGKNLYHIHQWTRIQCVLRDYGTVG